VVLKGQGTGAPLAHSGAPELGAPPPSEGLRGLLTRLAGEATPHPDTGGACALAGGLPLAARLPSSPASANAPGAPPRGAPAGSAVASTLHERDEERRLGERLERLLVREARRHGVDLGEVRR